MFVGMLYYFSTSFSNTGKVIIEGVGNIIRISYVNKISKISSLVTFEIALFKNAKGLILFQISVMLFQFDLINFLS